MAINLQSTRSIKSDGIKMLVYGAAGVGKTTLITTLPSPIILASEGGLLSISDTDIPYIAISTANDLRDAYNWIRDSEEATRYQSIAIDSISEVAEVVLQHEFAVHKDGRAAYGEMATTMQSLIRSFRDLPGRNVYMTAKLDKTQDDLGCDMYTPSMPGRSMMRDMPYFFDVLLALRAEIDGDGNLQRALMCEADRHWIAKSRIRGLEKWEQPDLGKIINKLDTQEDKK